jgi:dTDP-4-dehydrorhamnose 3,5-epimerase
MKVERLAIPDVILVTPQRHGDSRGFFSETYVKDRFQEAGISGEFVQDNQSMSSQPGVIRGLHCQLGPNAQGKLVRVIKGAIWDVAVDIRTGSETFGRHVAAELSAENWCQLWIPVGFLHGFCTLSPDTQVIYKVTAPYDRNAERGIIWNDPQLCLKWPVSADQALLSPKDLLLPGLDAVTNWFPNNL